jgi:hypothetical protein
MDISRLAFFFIGGPCLDVLVKICRQTWGVGLLGDLSIVVPSLYSGRLWVVGDLSIMARSLYPGRLWVVGDLSIMARSLFPGRLCRVCRINGNVVPVET